MAKNKKAYYQVLKLSKKLHRLESEMRHFEKKRVVKNYLIWVGMEKEQQDHQRKIWREYYMTTREWISKTKHLQVWYKLMEQRRIQEALQVAKAFKKALINNPDKRPQRPPYPDGIEMDYSSIVQRYQQVMDEIQQINLQLEEIKALEGISDDDMKAIEIIA